MAFKQNGGTAFFLQTGDTKRLQGMSQAVLTDSHLQLVQEGIHRFFHVLRDIVAPKDLGTKFSQKEIIKTLNRQETDGWVQIRTEVLNSHFHDYSDGKFTEEEDMAPVKIVFDLITLISNMKGFVKDKLEEYYNTETKLQKELENVRDELMTSQQEIVDMTWANKKDKAALNSVSSTIKHLEKVSKDKTEKITELQREGTVQLWQTEKQRVLAKSNERIRELEEEVAKLTSEKQALNKKLSMTDSQFRIQKLKNEIESTKPPVEDAAKELQKTKQHIYLLEKDLRSVEDELFTQQKYMIGIMTGLQGDYWETWETVMSEQPPPVRPEVVKQGRQLGLRVTRVKQALADGNLGAVRADLPDHYIATDRDVVRVPLKKLSSAYGARFTPAAKPTLKSRDSKLSEGSMESTTGEKVPGPPRLTRRSSVLPNVHPELVNPRTNIVNMINVMKHFHHMTQDYVTEQWEQFRRYDTNGDGELDLSEMMNAMTTTVGSQQFTAVQVREAMLEVDVDGSNTIDFFEYLSIANMVQHKKGRSDVFRSKLVQQQGRHVSKTCVIQ